MSTVLQKYFARLAGNDGVRTENNACKVVTMTMTGGTTASGSFILPRGSNLHGIRFETATAFSGTPTNINARLGTAAAGQQIVADVDVKGQGHISATIVAAYDVVNSAATADQTIFWQIAAVGGTTPAGTVIAVVNYSLPVP